MSPVLTLSTQGQASAAEPTWHADACCSTASNKGCINVCPFPPQGWLVLESASVFYEKARPYFPVIDLLKRYTHVEDGDEARTIRAKVTGQILTLDESLQNTIPPLLSLLAALPEGSPFLQLTSLSGDGAHHTRRSAARFPKSATASIGRSGLKRWGRHVAYTAHSGRLRCPKGIDDACFHQVDIGVSGGVISRCTTVAPSTPALTAIGRRGSSKAHTTMLAPTWRLACKPSILAPMSARLHRGSGLGCDGL
jgi:hypothetical protein